MKANRKINSGLSLHSMGMGDGGGGGGGGGGSGSCYVYSQSNPSTPGLVTPDKTFHRYVHMSGNMQMDDGQNVTMWGFRSSSGGAKPFPSPAIRVFEGEIVHTKLHLGMMNGVHTIHHHGIEPSEANDGVGHLSYDISGDYTYQWIASHAGTYFYHCHTNTVLHAEMGMYGGLIIDPVADPNDPPGTKRVFANGPTYDLEAIWACDDIDTNWHNKGWTAGTCGNDEGLNELNPNYFVITGVDGANSALTNPGVAVTMSVGQKLLVRYINAGYMPQRIHFGGLTATVVMSDGRAFPNAIQATELESVSAERYECIFEPTTPGVYTVTVEYLHWITGALLGTARTRITVV